MAMLDITAAPKLTLGAVSKATIRNLDTNETVECMFRPKEYTFDKQNTWESATIIGKNVPEVKFSGGKAMTLKMDLFFDTYETGADVRTKYTDKIWKLMMIDTKTKDKGHKGRPPQCEFRWGQAWSFKAVITSLNQTFTMFLADGKPVRSTMKVTFQQVAEEGRYPGQNPTSISAAGYKTRRVRQGETIDWIAYDEYGDPNLLRFLANTNNIDNPLRLEAGQLLAIPPTT